MFRRMERYYGWEEGILKKREFSFYESLDLDNVVHAEPPKDPYDFSEYSFEKTGEYLTFSEIAQRELEKERM